MKKKYIISCVIAVLSALIVPARKVTLEECMAMATDGNPALRSEQLNVEKNRILMGTAFDAPNTGIELSQDATDGGGMENGLKFSQEFDFPSVYVARRKALQSDYLVARSQMDVRRAEICRDVMTAYYGVLYVKRRIELLQELEGSYSRFEKTALERWEAGEASKLEYVNAGRLRSKVEMDLRDAFSELAAGRAALMAAIGTDEPVEPVETELPVLQLNEDGGGFVAGQTLAGRLLESELKRSERYVGLARQEFLPGLFVAATSQLVIKGFNPYHVERPRFDKGDFMGFQVGITVPLFFGAKRARLLAAKRDVEIARSRMDDANRRMSLEYAETMNEYTTALQNLKYYETDGLAQAGEIARLAQISYELGEIDYLEYMQNVETAITLEMEYIAAIDRLNKAVITLQMYLLSNEN